MTLLSQDDASKPLEIEPKNEELLNTSEPAHANSIFSKMAHSLKPDEALYIAKTSENKPSTQEIKVVKQSMSKNFPEGRIYRIIRTKKDCFLVQSLDWEGGYKQVIQFLNPIAKKPADVLVSQGDWITFPSLEGSKD